MKDNKKHNPRGNPVIREQRLKEAGMSMWIKDITTWDKQLFIRETEQAMFDAYGVDVKFDDGIINLLADQMETYVIAAAKLQHEDHVEMANNGARMQNPNLRIRDSALSRILQLLTTLGLAPNGRPKKANTPTEIDILLEGPQL